MVNEQLQDDVVVEEKPLSLRDALMSAVEKHTAEDVQESDQPSRARDVNGKFTKQEEAAPIEPSTPVESPVRPPKPSSWKKELDEHWNNADPKLAEYIVQREREYATGVSTYKQEAERAKELQQAIEPFIPELQRYNLKPTEWIQNLGNAHRTLALGTPQQKVGMFVQLARDYGIDLGQLGNIDSNQFAAPQYQPQVPQLDLSMIRNEVMEVLLQQNIESDIQQMAADKTNYPHFDQVKESMVGILQSGLAQDLKSAYDKAIRMNDDLWQAQQDARQKQSLAEQQARQAEAAKSARAKTVSVKSATPSGNTTTSTAKGRRDILAEQFATSAGRV